MLSIKISGLILLLLCCWIVGFLKSEQLILRKNKLDSFCKGFISLKERIRCGEGEINSLIFKSFSENLFYYENKTLHINKEHLKTDEISLIEEYLQNAGMCDVDSEFQKCTMYTNLLIELYKKADTDCSNLCKLYKSLGFLGGIFICIFFL